MDLISLNVNHVSFGKGTVVKFDGKQITVRFADKVSKFVYPTAFEKFIKAEDSIVQDAIMKEVAAAKLAKDERLQAELASRIADEEKRTTGKPAASVFKKPRNIESGFASDYNVKHLARQPILTYQQVEEQFGIKISGFGRGINVTPSTVVIISSVDKKKTGFVYHDHWTADGEYIYSGEGKTGDQKMSVGNRAIVDAADIGKDIHLFVKLSPQEYYYQGIFEFVNYTYDDDLDENGKIRKEYKFRLKKVPS